MLLAPFQLLADFLAQLGYPGSKRLVGLYWTRLGDELCFDDGQRSGCGLCDGWLYLNLIRRPDVAAWLDDNDLHLGNSDEQAEHWLVVFSQATWELAAAILLHLLAMPGPGEYYVADASRSIKL